MESTPLHHLVPLPDDCVVTATLPDVGQVRVMAVDAEGLIAYVPQDSIHTSEEWRLGECSNLSEVRHEPYPGQVVSDGQAHAYLWGLVVPQDGAASLGQCPICMNEIDADTPDLWFHPCGGEGAAGAYYHMQCAVELVRWNTPKKEHVLEDGRAVYRLNAMVCPTCRNQFSLCDFSELFNEWAADFRIAQAFKNAGIITPEDYDTKLSQDGNKAVRTIFMPKKRPQRPSDYQVIQAIRGGVSLMGGGAFWVAENKNTPIICNPADGGYRLTNGPSVFSSLSAPDAHNMHVANIVDGVIEFGPPPSEPGGGLYLNRYFCYSIEFACLAWGSELFNAIIYWDTEQPGTVFLTRAFHGSPDREVDTEPRRKEASTESEHPLPGRPSDEVMRRILRGVRRGGAQFMLPRKSGRLAIHDPAGSGEYTPGYWSDHYTGAAGHVEGLARGNYEFCEPPAELGGIYLGKYHCYMAQFYAGVSAIPYLSDFYAVIFYDPRAGVVYIGSEFRR
ncbi:hypothetical protein ACIQWN_38575 [Streptomyces vinaceus]|uniref:hypothetical protein n=1 Tax=Streptomyces vinaceus TaxID=1960 RepID=UPI0037F243E0